MRSSLLVISSWLIYSRLPDIPNLFGLNFKMSDGKKPNISGEHKENNYQAINLDLNRGHLTNQTCAYLVVSAEQRFQQVFLQPCLSTLLFEQPMSYLKHLAFVSPIHKRNQGLTASHIEECVLFFSSCEKTGLWTNH